MRRSERVTDGHLGQRAASQRLGAIAAVVLALHGFAAMYLYRQSFESHTIAMPPAMTVAIRFVAAIPAPPSAAAKAHPAAAATAAPSAPLNKAVETPPRIRGAASRDAGRADADVAHTSKPARIEPPHQESMPRAPIAEPQTQSAASSAASSSGADPSLNPRASSSATPERQASEAAAGEAQTEPILNAAYLRNPAPDYPPMALQRRWEGTVLLKVRVLAGGSAQQVTVITSSGHASLDDAAVQAVTAWRFIPARRGGQAIDGWVRVPVVFKAE